MIGKLILIVLHIKKVFVNLPKQRFGEVYSLKSRGVTFYSCNDSTNIEQNPASLAKLFIVLGFTLVASPMFSYWIQVLMVLVQKFPLFLHYHYISYANEVLQTTHSWKPAYLITSACRNDLKPWIVSQMFIYRLAAEL